MKKAIHYINQFFGQIGGETAAGYPLHLEQGVVGPGMALQAALKDELEIVATIVCGDNYFHENEQVKDEIADILKQYQPDILIAGPAFFAGRYGMACGEVCKIADKLLIPAVTGMFEENPAVDIYRNHAFIVPTKNSAAGMRTAAGDMSRLILKIVRGEELTGPEQDGYFKRNIRVQYRETEIAAVRGVNMLLDKIAGRPFTTELPMPKYELVKPSAPIANLSKAKIALITSGGIVPKGNPDHLESAMCTRFGQYSYEDDFGGVEHIQGEVCHGGYDGTFCNEDPNRMLAADVMNELVQEGYIGGLYPYAFVTSGSGMLTQPAVAIGREIQAIMKREGIAGAILTSA